MRRFRPPIPGVVYASISGYGQHGPWRSRMAYAPTVQAETGITANTVEHFGLTESMRSDALSHADIYSGLHAAIAILAALVRRARTGVGQYIDVAMAAVMMSVNERVHVDLGDDELGDERPILGATDWPFFSGPNGERFASPMSSGRQHVLPVLPCCDETPRSRRRSAVPYP